MINIICENAELVEGGYYQQRIHIYLLSIAGQRRTRRGRSLYRWNDGSFIWLTGRHGPYTQR